VAGIVGAGGNAGSVVAGFLFKGSLPWTQAFLTLGAVITGISLLSFAVRFSEVEEQSAGHEIATRLSASLAAVPTMGD
jgi:MFS transporter, NNP family, nitrate/nitrite transporter